LGEPGFGERGVEKLHALKGAPRKIGTIHRARNKHVSVECAVCKRDSWQLTRDEHRAVEDSAVELYARQVALAESAASDPRARKVRSAAVAVEDMEFRQIEA